MEGHEWMDPYWSRGSIWVHMLYVGMLVGGVGEKGGGRVKCESVSVSWLGEVRTSVCVCACLSAVVQPSQLNTGRRVVESDAHQPGPRPLFPPFRSLSSQDPLVPPSPMPPRCLSLPILGRRRGLEGSLAAAREGGLPPLASQTNSCVAPNSYFR